MMIKIYNMSGAGNLFSVIDNREYNFSIDNLKQLAPILCRKNETNIHETEGLIAINQSDIVNFSAEFLNPDGSHGAMCGNGGRCAVYFAKYIDIISSSEDVQFKMAGDTYTASIIENGIVSLRFPPPKEIKQDFDFEFNSRILEVSYVDVGSQHVVIDFNELNIDQGFREFDMNQIGKDIRFHKSFAPSGVNVNIYQIDGDCIQLRTYERGVEAETGACGTGAISTAIICANKHKLQFKIDIIPPSRQKLSVDCKFNNSGTIESLYLIGPAEIIDEYVVLFDNNEKA